jgi:hypothetical protein
MFVCVLVVDADLEVYPKDKDRSSSSDQRQLMRRDKLDADDSDGSFDSSDTVSFPSCVVVVVISAVLIVCITACQSNPPLLCFVGQRASE